MIDNKHLDSFQENIYQISNLHYYSLSVSHFSNEIVFTGIGNPNWAMSLKDLRAVLELDVS